MNKMRPFLPAFGVFLIGFLSILAETALFFALNPPKTSFDSIVFNMITSPFAMLVLCAGSGFMGWGVSRAVTLLQNKQQ